MTSSFELWLQGTPVDAAFYDLITNLEIEEHADLPGVLHLRLGLARSADGELTAINDPGLQPMATIAVVATVADTAPQCIFDGYILSHKLHLETGVTASHLEVQAQDASWPMSLEEKTREWAEVTDGAVANTVFGEYGMTPGPDNLTDDSPAHTEDGHTLMQRDSDWQFLRRLARRTGRLCRVAGGAAPQQRLGIFAAPLLAAEPAFVLKPNDLAAPNIGALDIEWDIARPAKAIARQARLTEDSTASGDTQESGLAPMDARALATFAGQTMTTILTSPADDDEALRARAAALLREAGWFVRLTGEVDAAALHGVLRVGGPVGLAGVGSVHSGNYLVWSVHHRLDDQSHKMKFVLVRNAVGPAPAAVTGGPPGGGLS